MKRVQEQGVTALGYDGDQNLATLTDPEGNTSRWTWGRRNRLKSFTNALGQETRVTYGPSGRPNAIINHRNEATRMEHDAQGRLKALVDPVGGRFELAYTPSWDLGETKDPLGNRTTRTYDARRRLASVGHADGTSTTFSWLPDGYLRSVKDESGNTVITLERDRSGRITGLVDAKGARIGLTRDADGRVTVRRDRSGAETRYAYDGMGRLASITFPDSNVYRLIYDTEGNLTSVKTARGGEWTFTFDGKNRLVLEKDPLGAERRYGWDGANNLTRIDLPGEGAARIVTTLRYDGLRRPLAVSSADRTMRIAYSDSDHRVDIDLEPEGTHIERRFDALDRLVRESVTGAAPSVTEYAWDSASNIKGVKLDGVDVLDYGYDRRNRVTAIRDVRRGREFRLAYTPAGELSEIAFPTGVKKTQAWGSRGELTSYAYLKPDGSVILRRTLGYDEELRLKTVSDDAGVLVSYGYDLRGQLLRADYRGGGFEAWTYDANGNIATYQTSGGSGARGESRQHDAADGLSRIDSVGATGVATATIFTLDGRGNIVRQASSGEVRELSWDSQGWLKQVRDNGQVKLEATYLDDYRLATLKDGDETSSMAWMGGNILSEHVGGMEKVFNVALLGLDENIETGPPAGPRETLVTDQVESFLAGLDDTGAVVRAASLGAFGELRLGPDPGSVGFAGARRHQATGYSFMRNRWYDPKLGRFLSRDPIGFAGGLNLYAYTENNPLVATDPLGLLIERRAGTNTDRLLGIIESTALGTVLVATINALSAQDITVRIRRSSNIALWDSSNTTNPLQQFGNEVDMNAYRSQHSACSLELGNTPRFSVFEGTQEFLYTRVFAGSHEVLRKNPTWIEGQSGHARTQMDAVLSEMQAGRVDNALAITLFHELVHIYQILQHIRNPGSTLISPDAAEQEAYRRTVEEYLPFRR